MPLKDAELAVAQTKLIAEQALHRLMFGKAPDTKIDLPEGEVVNPTVYVAMSDIRCETLGSGPMKIFRGQEVSSAPLLKVLLAQGADIRPLR